MSVGTEILAGRGSHDLREVGKCAGATTPQVGGNSPNTHCAEGGSVPLHLGLFGAFELVGH